MIFLVVRSFYVSIACAVCCGVLGCGSSAASVTGQVTLNAQPVTTGVVTFHLQGKGETVAIGQIDKSGKFQLMVGTDTALPPGDYVATVSITELVPASNPMEEAIYKELAPEKYLNTTTSGLQFSVKGGSNYFTIPLTSS